MSKPVGNTPLAQALNHHIRNELRMNPHQFALKIGLSPSQIARIISGEGNPLGPSGHVRELLASEFGYSVPEFEKRFTPSNTDTQSLIKINSFVELVEMSKKNADIGLPEEEIIAQIEKNDQDNYTEVYDNPAYVKRIVEKEGSFEWGKFMRQNSNYCKMLVNYNNDKPEIIGDWQFTPIYEKDFVNMKGDSVNNVLPTITETDLSDNKIPAMVKEGEYHIFLINYSINPLFNNPTVNKEFMKSFLSTIKDYEKAGIYIKDILVRPCNSIYQNVFRDYGFEVLDNTGLSEDGTFTNVANGGQFPLYYLDDVKKLM